MKESKNSIQSKRVQLSMGMPEFMNRFERHLKLRGHTFFTSQKYLSATKLFLLWLETRPLDERKISGKTIQEFLSMHRPVCHCHGTVQKDIKTVRAALNQLLGMEGYERVLSTVDRTFPEIEIEIDLFDRYLRKICGHLEATRWYHRRHVRKFLSWLFDDRPIQISRITPENLCLFVSKQVIGLRPSSIGVLVYSLRTYLKYLQFNGYVTPSLQTTIPRPPNWSGANLPHALSPDELVRFWSAFDRKTAIGRRDYAMARCLADLGLRCYEVANMQLDSIDWNNGILNLTKTKSRREETLPIPDKMGQALIVYLRYGRPKTKSRSIFVSHRAPLGQAVQNSTVRGAIRRAFSRTGLPWSGTHILRSTVASRLLESGATLKEVADLLRHRSIDTTKTYLKIDLSHLSQVALPWPGRPS